MPAYDYLCESCGGRFERRQKMSEPAIATCPACGGGVRRLISGGAGVVSKDGGCGGGGGCESGGPCCGGQEMACRSMCGCGH
jgi:putative FmdB family regulatory protein